MRNFTKTQRLVIKVGTNVLSLNSGVDTDFLRVIARQIAQLVAQGRQIILVTSGAIGMGAGALGIAGKITDVKTRQACAAVGQSILMHQYQQAFSVFDQKVAQVLLTNNILSNRRSYLNLRNTMDTLLSMGIVPIINENDCVSIDEIDLAFGDNDRLSALVASKMDAELLIILTDVAGLYRRRPRPGHSDPVIPLVHEITDEIRAMAGKAGSHVGTGGMLSKLQAIDIAAQGGCKVVLAHGREKDVIAKIVAGTDIGTLFLPKRRLSNRKRWILNCPAQGSILIDPGAANALKCRKSLLLVGVTAIKGRFDSGDVVDINDFAKGIATLPSHEIADYLAARNAHTDATSKRRLAVHANNMVLWD